MPRSNLDEVVDAGFAAPSLAVPAIEGVPPSECDVGDRCRIRGRRASLAAQATDGRFDALGLCSADLASAHRGSTPSAREACDGGMTGANGRAGPGVRAPFDVSRRTGYYVRSLSAAPYVLDPSRRTSLSAFRCIAEPRSVARPAAVAVSNSAAIVPLAEAVVTPLGALDAVCHP